MAVLTALCLSFKSDFPWLVSFPKEWTLPLAAYVNAVTDAVVSLVQPGFRALSALLDLPMRDVRLVLAWLPWPAVMLAVAALALKASGERLAIFAVVALAYILLAGYWQQSMNTLALVLLAVPISMTVGFLLGVLGRARPRVRPALLFGLDLMQTVPAFAYLIPLLLLFGFGPVVGLIASAIYATPPMVRNTMLGLDRVPAAVREAGLMSGCTRRQQFWQVEVPTALPQILVGFNQTTMAALSMVIVAAIIGGFEDIGWEVLSSMRKAEFGQSILSGLVIALLAILIDRMTIGFAKASTAGADARHAVHDEQPTFGILAFGSCIGRGHPVCRTECRAAAEYRAAPGDGRCQPVAARAGARPCLGVRRHPQRSSLLLAVAAEDRHFGGRHAGDLGLFVVAAGIGGLCRLRAGRCHTFAAVFRVAGGPGRVVAGLVSTPDFLGLPWPVFILCSRAARLAGGGLAARPVRARRLLADPRQRTCGRRWSSRSISARWRSCSACCSAARSGSGRPIATAFRRF